MPPSTLPRPARRLPASQTSTHVSRAGSPTLSAPAQPTSPSPLLASTSSASSTPRDVSPGTSTKRSVGASALLAAVKHGKGHLDKAMRYLLDSDAMPDKCMDPIWILGIKHPGWEPPPSSLAPSSLTKSLRSSVSSTSDQGSHAKPGVVQWPPVFYADFASRVWLTYRSHFTPIRDVRLGDLDAIGVDCGSLVSVSASGLKTNANTRERKDKEKERDWRQPPHPIPANYATYVQILTWFLDTPEAPFRVHRMALAGKELGKDVGQWFGPSTAAGAIK
ncbi:hypothetical protein C0995_006364 [Termitomyces sp. Mi166|nr:hypothetical protein C0995_006364 [Termitomyces sp. Mi166\